MPTINMTDKEFMGMVERVLDAAAQEGGRQTEESARVKSEEGRAEAETARAGAEEGRTRGEARRESAEAARDAAEEFRAGAEARRESAEGERDLAETARRNAENSRGTSEAVRVEGELERRASETQRGENEAARGVAEEARAGAETARKSAEAVRTEREVGRVEAETVRAGAEERREADHAALCVWEEYDPAKRYQPMNKVSFEGSSYLCTAETVGHAPTEEGYWRIIAARGEAGPAGAQGPAGPAGKDGAVGPAGPRGAKGDKGDQGDKGDTGAQGPAGAQGPKGEAGATGAQGPGGATGPQGPKGDPAKVCGRSADASGNIALTCTDVGALPVTGGTLTGNLTLKGSGNFGTKINFGDGDYVHLYEITDDKLEIKASNLDLVVSGKALYKGQELAGKFTPVTVTVSTSWSGSGPWTQTVTVSGVTASDTGLGVYPVDIADAAARKLYNEAYGCLSAEAETVAGGVKLTCRDKKPAISFQIKVQGVR